MSVGEHVQASTARLQELVWHGAIHLEIVLSPLDCRSYDDSLPFMIQFPRLSYLPFLLDRLHAFFAPFLINPDVAPHEGWLSFEDVPLKWQYPVGLLYDLFSGVDPASLDGLSGTPKKDSQSQNLSPGEGRIRNSPWRLVLHYTDWPSESLIPLDETGKAHEDSFVNNVKEADFLRNGTAKVILSLSKEDTLGFWHAVKDHNFGNFDLVNRKCLSPPDGDPIRNVPLKVYLPSTATSEHPQGSLRVVQSPIPPMLSQREPQTLGTALHGILPTVFPSRRSYIHAIAVLHGAVVPLAANLQDLMRHAAYADGFLHIAVVMVA